NKRWLEYTGLSADRAAGWGWKTAIDPDHLPRMLEVFQAAVDSGKSFEVEGRFRRYDGEYRWFLFRGSPLLDASGQVVKWYGTNTDLEDRKRAEEVLQSNERSLREIIDCLQGFVSTANAEGKLELFSRPVLEYFGKT